MPHIHVHMLPLFLADVDLGECTAVMIDVLRASTTITHALVNGAESVLPTQTVEQALECAKEFPAEALVLGGERGGELIPGFDLDNSPLKYTREMLTTPDGHGKTLVFTTTNGTQALRTCAKASNILIGAFVNLSAVVHRMQTLCQNVHLVCAGTNGQLTAEDLLFAGAVTDRLLTVTSGWEPVGVQTQMTLDFYRTHATTPESFRETFQAALGSQNLIRLNLQDDIDRCREHDRFDVVPVWNPETNRITLG